MKNQADVQYKRIIERIDEIGVWDKGTDVRTKWIDGTPAYTKSWFSERMVFDGTEVPILTTKKVAWKTSIKETLWMWQQKSNVVQDLRDVGVNIWNEWELPDGTIGNSYGYQLGKKNRKIYGRKYMEVDYTVRRLEYMVDQVDYLLHELKNNPTSRRHIITLWNPDDLDMMSLTPCVYESQWYIKGGKIHLEVRARSNDMALGAPVNIFQYHVLHRMIAQVTGYELGEYIYNIGDVHIYERHLETLKEQVNRPFYEPPTLWINPEVKDFYKFTADDFKLIDYQHGNKTSYEVAI